MTPRPRVRKARRSARRRSGRARTLPTAPAPGASAGPRAAAPAVVSRDTPLAVKGLRSLRPGPGVAIRRLLVAGLVLGPGIGIALGPWLASGRLPLFESRISWQGAPPAVGEWPRARGRGESAVTRDIGARTFLIARAPTAAAAEALALELALPRLSRAPELAAARAERREQWSAALLQGPRAPLTPAGRCAALLRGWADAWRAVATPPAGPGVTSEPASARHESPVPEMSREVTRRALEADADGLGRALDREARVARARFFTRMGVLHAGERAVAMNSWRRAWRVRAAEMDSLAEALVARKPRIERELVLQTAPGSALEAEAHIPDPGVTLLLAAGSEPTAARPVAATWALFALAGSALAMALAAPLARSAARARRERREALMRRWQIAGDAFAAVPPLTPGPVEARLLILSGSRPRRVARATRELAARFVAAGERVLVIDAARNFRLHDFFGAQSRLGFQECMREEAPLLGVVQSGGAPGLYVLAHGNPSRLPSWEPLGRLLDHAHAHFTRVLLALDPDVPRQAGEALAGRLMDGWWAAADARKERDARRLSARLGVALQGLEPAISEHEPLEEMVQGFVREAQRTAAPPVAALDAAAHEETPAAAEPVAPARESATLAGLVEEIAGEAVADQATELRKLDELVEELARDAARRLAAADAASGETPGAVPVADPQEPVEAQEFVEAMDFVEAPEADSWVEPAEAHAVAGAHEVAAAHDFAEEQEIFESQTIAVTQEAEPEPGPGPAFESEPQPEPYFEPAITDPATAYVDTEAPGLAPAPAQVEAPGSEVEPEAPDPTAEEVMPVAMTAAEPEEPVVLESDPEVGERLRFLIWMRRLRDRKRGEVTHAR